MNSKRNFLVTIIVLIVTFQINGQIRLYNSTSNNSAPGSSAFIDASTNGLSNGSTNLGKGLLYPRVDLTTFISFGGGVTGTAFNYPTRYDGFVVYNTGTGNTLATAADAIIAITPGFWYYDNKSTSIKGGTWKQLGSDSVKNYTTTPIKTATSIDGAQVWALKGDFISPLNNATAVISIPKPTDFNGYFKMITYKDGKTFRSDISSLTVDTLDSSKLILVTGNGLFSEVYPAGNYTYTLEYFK